MKNLRIAWRQSSMPLEVRRGRGTVAVPTNYQVTPLMVDGLLYMTAGDGSVAALHPATGAVVWTYVPPRVGEAPRPENDPPGEMLVGRSANRGLAYWADGSDARVIAICGQSLVALNAKTGAPAAGFGTGGTVDLSKGYRRPAASMRWTSVPVIVRDMIVVGGLPTAPDGNFLPGDIRGYDVRTGKQVWTFNVIPEFGDVGNDTWLKDSYAYSGGAGVWGLMSADDELGYVYVATETPSSRGGDFWGGQRPGNNLFAESLVCLDARNGKRVWHFQAVHHGIWDYDFNAQPNLVDITVNGRRIKAIAEVSKQAFVYVLDRVTGQPVWPIEERPVPAGNTPGEWYAPTQPFPTKPPAYDQQGVTIDDLIDFTPELRQEAIKILSQYRYGGLFTPPTVAEGPTKGTVQMPGAVGGSNWTGAGVDPETGILYVTSVHAPFIAEMVNGERPRSGKRQSPARSRGGRYRMDREARRRRDRPVADGSAGPSDLQTAVRPAGRHRSQPGRDSVDRGQRQRSPRSSRHQALEPAAARPGRPRVAARHEDDGVPRRRWEQRGGRASAGRRRKNVPRLRQTTGQVLWEMELPGGTTGAPMTYMFDGKQYIVVATGWKDMASELVALALP